MKKNSTVKNVGSPIGSVGRKTEEDNFRRDIREKGDSLTEKERKKEQTSKDKGEGSQAYWKTKIHNGTKDCEGEGWWEERGQDGKGH